jgi:nucleoside-triphosphatase THEP1
MHIAAVTAPSGGALDLLLADFAWSLIAEGLRPAGLIQVNTARAGVKRCDMDVQVLPEGRVFRISQSLGPGARGCHLDPDGLEGAISAVRADLADQRPDILIVNKFGKHEAEGRGFASLIADVLEAGIPVLVGVNGLNREAFARYAGGLAEMLDPDIATVRSWLRSAMCDEPA